jgi:hypothetical protein
MTFSDDSEQSLYSTKKRTQACLQGQLITESWKLGLDVDSVFEES